MMRMKRYKPHDIATKEPHDAAVHGNPVHPKFILAQGNNERWQSIHRLKTKTILPLVKRYSTPMKNKTIGENIGEHRIHDLHETTLRQ